MFGIHTFLSMTLWFEIQQISLNISSQSLNIDIDSVTMFYTTLLAR